MISAMPAVAVRRERKKHRAARGSAPTSVHSSMSSLSQQRSTLGSARRSNSQSVSTITSSTSSQASYLSALHRVRDRQLQAQREKSRFFVYSGTVLITAGLVLVFIGIAISVQSAQTIGLLFIGLGSIFCLAKVFCFQKQVPLVKKARTVNSSGQSIYNAAPSNVTTPGTDDSYYFPAVPMHRLPTSPTQETTSTVHSVHRVHSIHSVHSNPSSLLTPMSLNSIPEMQVLITDDSQRY